MIESTITEQVHSVLKVLSKAQYETRTTNGNSSEVDHTLHTTDRVNNPLEDTSNFQNSDTMPYLHPHYNDEAYAKVHVRAFLTTWQTNHVSQWLAEANANASKKAKFGLSLDGWAVNWYSQHDQGEFEYFKQLTNKFVKLFHWRIAQRELMSQFYAIGQDAHKIVPQFVIRF